MENPTEISAGFSYLYSNQSLKTMTNLQENWVPIPGYEKFYQITSTGRIKRIGSPGSGRSRDDRFRYPQDSGFGYKYITLHSVGKRKNFYMHRLLATIFIPNPENKPLVNHINGVKSDNRIENLEWCTLSENMIHAYGLGLIPKGEANHMSKITEAEVLQIRSLHNSGESRPSLAVKFGISKANVHRIIHKQIWRHL